MESRAPVTEERDPPNVPDWPLGLSLPVDVVSKRITPMLSDRLKERRRGTGPWIRGEVDDSSRARSEGGCAASARCHHRLRDGVSELEDNSVGSLRTPFALQRSEDQTGEWGGGVRGLSVRVDVRALAIHVFLGRLGNDTGLTWDAFRLYDELRGAGLR